MRRHGIEILPPLFFCFKQSARVRVRPFSRPIGVNEINKKMQKISHFMRPKRPHRNFYLAQYLVLCQVKPNGKQTGSSTNPRRICAGLTVTGL